MGARMGSLSWSTELTHILFVSVTYSLGTAHGQCYAQGRLGAYLAQIFLKKKNYLHVL